MKPDERGPWGSFTKFIRRNILRSDAFGSWSPVLVRAMLELKLAIIPLT